MAVRAHMLFFVLIAAAEQTAAAQLDPRLRIGAQVRLRGPASDAPAIAGTLSAIEGDTLVVNQTRHALTDIRELAVYARGKGAQTTATVFGTVGFLTGSVVYLKWCADNLDTCEIVEEDDDPNDDEEPNSPFAFVAFGSAMLFAAVGYALAPPTWHIVDLPVRVGIAPMQRGVGAYVSIPAPRFIRAR
jgi:hypothetical protein